MQYLFDTHNRPCSLIVTAKTDRPEKVFVKVYDKNKDNSVYTDRYTTVKGEKQLQVNIPLVVSREAIIDIKSESGKLVNVNLKRKPLLTNLDFFDYNNKTIKDMIKFTSLFCRRCGYIDSRIWLSSDRKFKVLYENQLYNKGGRVSNTSAMTGVDTGIVQVSKSKFKNKTIPMRYITMLHEFSHFYLNKDIYNEYEADFNAVKIYLGLGFPEIEAIKAFTRSFGGADTKENRKRYQALLKYINQYNKIQKSYISQGKNLKRA